MTVVPLPDVPCLRTRFVWNEGAEGEGGIRLYFKYSGSAPSGANCATLASDMSSAWGTHIATQLGSNCSLNEVDVLDIATDSGLSGQWSGSIAGGNSSPFSPWQVAMDVEFGIGRRYRGGKPRCYLPPLTESNWADPAHWTSGAVSSVNTAFAAFISEITALSVGSVGTLGHVTLSYYKGFTNITNSSGRTRAVPSYRATALHDDVTSYIAKTEFGSQRRRRTSTSP
jgi:hypothetical protein